MSLVACQLISDLFQIHSFLNHRTFVLAFLDLSGLPVKQFSHLLTALAVSYDIEQAILSLNPVRVTTLKEKPVEN